MSGYLDKLREHEFDGIREFDNYLPRWWLWSFYLACIFSGIYWLHYHGVGFGPSAAESYERAYAAKMQREAASKPITRQLLEDYAKQPSAVAAGKDVFTSICAACHKPDGSGQAGPNLTDKYWLHGGQAEQIYKTVFYGSPTNQNMVPWGPQLGRTRVMDVVSYVLSIKNQNLPGNPPEGKPEN